MVQVIGSHQLGPEAKEKALKRREKVAATEHKSSASERAEAQQQKRFEKQQEQMVSTEQTCKNLLHLPWSTVHFLCSYLKLLSMHDEHGHWPQSCCQNNKATSFIAFSVMHNLSCYIAAVDLACCHFAALSMIV